MKIKWLPIQDNIVEGSCGTAKFYIMLKKVPGPEPKWEVVSSYVVDNDNPSLPGGKEKFMANGMDLQQMKDFLTSFWEELHD